MREIHIMHEEQDCGCSSGHHEGRHHKGRQQHGAQCGCSCSCGCGCKCGGGFKRHFITREERSVALIEYREQLKKELQGIEEHLEKLGS